MPIVYSIDRLRRRLFAMAKGTVPISEVVAHLWKERDDNGLPLTELIDATQATVSFSDTEIRKIIDLLRELGRRNALGPTAVVTGDDVSYGIMRMLGILIEDVCDVRPFRSCDKAEEWLNTIPKPRLPTQER